MARDLDTFGFAPTFNRDFEGYRERAVEVPRGRNHRGYDWPCRERRNRRCQLYGDLYGTQARERMAWGPRYQRSRRGYARGVGSGSTNGCCRFHPADSDARRGIDFGGSRHACRQDLRWGFGNARSVERGGQRRHRRR